MPDFSVHETNFYKRWELNSTDENLYPTYNSIESFIGRKCFEFAWINGDETFTIGIRSASEASVAFFYGGLGNELFRSRKPGGSPQEDIRTPLLIKFLKNTRYMICYDMKVNKVLLIYGNKTYSYNHNFLTNTKWKIYFAQGSPYKNDVVEGYFHYFENPLPVAFYSMVDRRCYDYISNKNNELSISYSLFLVNIMYKS